MNKTLSHPLLSIPKLKPFNPIRTHPNLLSTKDPTAAAQDVLNGIEAANRLSGTSVHHRKSQARAI
jgi:hypothetical protein